jgi:hypothetical protein
VPSTKSTISSSFFLLLSFLRDAEYGCYCLIRVHCFFITVMLY